MNSTHMVKETEVSPRVANCDEITVDGNFATKSLRSVWIVGLNDLIFAPKSVPESAAQAPMTARSSEIPTEIPNSAFCDALEASIFCSKFQLVPS